MPEANTTHELVKDPAEVGIDAEALAALIARCRREVDNGLLPSSQMAVAAGDRLVAYETFGDAAPDSRYVIFSCTKAVVVAAFWLLLGDGSIALDQRVAEVIPEFATNGKDVITVRQLLLHEGGFPNAPLNLETDVTRQQRLARFASWRLNWEPGTRFEYHATSAHWVIAELIERLSGVEYRAFVQERILEPLGLKRLRLGVAVQEQGDINDLEVRGEPATNEELEAVLGIPGITLEAMQGEVTDAALVAFNRPAFRAMGVPGGGGISTAADLALYYQALLHNPGRLWDPAVLAAGTREVHGVLPDPWYHVSSNRALGTVIAGEGQGAAMRGFGRTVSPRTFGHAGAGGQIAFADPDVDVSFCYLTNGLDANILRQGRRTASIASCVGPLTSSP
ncbi:MAG: serine hydrolase domain-containing protein [Acidimicrobiales bacterium]